MRRSVGVAAVGDVLDVNCWSNIPYYFYQMGQKQELFNQPWRLDLNAFNNQRKFWNLLQLLKGRGKGGFQYSQLFINKAEQQIPHDYFSSTVISFNQTFPRSASINKNGGKIFYYIDTTLYDLFNESSYEVSVPKWIKSRALAQERDNYHNAEKVVVMGNWVAESLRSFYGLPPEKILSILPGANIDLPKDFVQKTMQGNPGTERDLILGFVGKDWKRKGLLVLIDVCQLLKQKGYKVKIKAIGNCPEELRDQDCLEFSGFINKQNQTLEFIETISACDIGCLFSRSEALGISTLEFLRLGVPVAGYYHQGLKDTLLEGASLRFNLTDSIETIAIAFETYIENKTQQQMLRAKALEYSSFVTWERCISEWGKLLGKYE